MGDFKTGGHFDSLYEAGEKMGFARGGAVKDTGNMPATKGDSQQEIEAGGRAKVRPGYKHGGKKKKAMKGGHMESKAPQKMPKNVKKRGGSAHASKYAHGGKMKHGGPYNSEPMYGKD